MLNRKCSVCGKGIKGGDETIVSGKWPTLAESTVSPELVNNAKLYHRECFGKK